MSDDRQMMKSAAQEARKSLFLSGDNPRVGCVVVKDGKIVGRGHTQKPGGHHAEIMALKEAGEQAHGATAYVTLEPCSFTGRTPPCADALIKAGIKNVVMGMDDPHPKVSGAGRQILKQTGISVSDSPLSKKDISLNQGFFQRMKTGRPWVRVKMAQSLDGRTAMANGDSVWITGEKARKDVQVWRARSQAILTGIGTVLSDDCRLSVRPESFPAKYQNLKHEFDRLQPLRAILDTNLQTPVDAKILKGPGRKIILTAATDAEKIGLLENAGAEIIQMSVASKGQIALEPVLDWFGKEQINDLLVECGATLAGSFIQERIANQAIIYTAPVFMGSSARPLFNFSIEEMEQRHHITNVKFKRMGKDWRIIADI